MSLKTALKAVLGNFWYNIWKDDGIVDSMVRTLSQTLLSNLNCATFDLQKSWWLNNSQAQYADSDLVPVYIPKSSVHATYIPVTSFVTGTSEVQGDVVQNSWTCTTVNTLPNMFYMQDDVSQTARVLLPALDYTVESQNKFCLLHDPSTTLKSTLISYDDKIIECYQAWCLVRKDRSRFYNFGFLTNQATVNGNTVQQLYSMRCNGASIYNIKSYIGQLYDCQVAQQNQTVQQVVQQQLYKYVLTQKHAYRIAPQFTINVVQNESIAVGQSLCEFPQVYTYKDSPTSAALPGIGILTNAGRLTAPNSLQTTTTVDVLPLTGQPATLTKYNTMAQEALADNTVPYCSIPNSVNPMLFLLKRACAPFMFLVGIPKAGANCVQTIRKMSPCTSLPVFFTPAVQSQALKLVFSIQDAKIIYLYDSSNIDLTINMDGDNNG